jgi:single-strand DNA-binding protein
MSSFNRVILMGNLTRDPELRYIPSGTAVCEFGLAVNRTWKDKDGNSKDEVSFFDCVAWARTAEVIAEHMKKGRPILIEGYLKQETWQDKNGGGNRSKVKIIVDRFSFVGGRSDAAGGPPPAAEEAPAAAPVSDDDVPF